MRLRSLLLALMLAATAAFVVGVVIERNSGEHHSAAVEATEHHPTAEHHDEGTEAGHAETHTEATPTASTHAETGEELRPLGIDIEAAPFVALAAAVSLLLALAAWLRPNPVLLVVVAVTMLAFAVLDVREIAHQLDEDRTGLALLAALVAALHAGSAAVAVLLARARPGESAGSAGTIPA